MAPSSPRRSSATGSCGTCAMPQPTSAAVPRTQLLAPVRDKNVQILDARTRDEFAGLDVRAIRGGHVPGAVNIPYEENWADPDTAGKLARREVANNRGMSLKSDADLRN